MAEKRTTITVYGKKAIRAKKAEPMPRGQGWPIVNVKGTRERRKIRGLQSAFLAALDRAAIIKLRHRAAR